MRDATSIPLLSDHPAFERILSSGPAFSSEINPVSAIWKRTFIGSKYQDLVQKETYSVYIYVAIKDNTQHRLRTEKSQYFIVFVKTAYA